MNALSDTILRAQAGYEYVTEFREEGFQIFRKRK